MVTKILKSKYLIHEAVVDCDFSMIKLLLEKNPSLLEQRDSQGRTPLLCAITNRRDSSIMEVIEYLIAQGANVNAIIDHPGNLLHGKTALQCARERNYSVTVTLLVAAGARDALFNGEYLIHEAVVDCDFSMIKLLLEKNPSLLEQRDSQGRTPLLYAITNRRDSSIMKVIEYLIAQGANVNAIIDHPWNLLHGKTALQCARERNYSVTVTLLVAAGALDALFKGEYLIHEAVVDCDFSMIKLLLEKNPSLLEQRDSKGRTPLLYAITNRRSSSTIEVIEYLIAQGANVKSIIDCPGDQLHGVTALQYATEHKLRGILTALIQAGALDVDVPSVEVARPGNLEDATQTIGANIPETFFYSRKPKRLEFTAEEFSWRNE